MKIIISGKHIELTRAIKDYIQTKIIKVEKFEDSITEVDVKIEVEGDLQKVVSTAYLKGKTIRVEEKDKDLYKAIDLMVDVLTRQIRKYKEKKSN